MAFASLVFGLTVSIAKIHEWYDRVSSERLFGLRSGILTHFRESKIDLIGLEGEAESYSFRVFSPQSQDRQSTYPVVVCLHGAGERGFDNAKQLKGLADVFATTSFQERDPCFVIAPQCPPESDWSWFRQSTFAAYSDYPDPLIAIIEQVLVNPKADRKRVYLIGFSLGSFGAWELAAEFPEKFAAVVPIAGGVEPSIAASLTTVPIWAIHGDADTVCTVQATREIVVRLKEYGANVRYSELQGVGHASWRPSLQAPSEVLQWMFQQKRID